MKKFTKVVLNVLAVCSLVGFMAACANETEEELDAVDTTAVYEEPMVMDTMMMDTMMVDTTMATPGM